MITISKIKIYRKYDGDLDAWARVSNPKDTQVIDEADWMEIDRIVQSLSMVQKNLVAEDYKAKILDDVHRLCADKQTVEMLFELSRQ